MWDGPIMEFCLVDLPLARNGIGNENTQFFSEELIIFFLP